ncbi:MAG TPA: RES domain-containing protein, partial [Terrimesophilobacter sp.]|nr:RES domain-containing protein [Terrimesophilobacter sp.]
MTSPGLEIESSDDLGDVWHVGFAPNSWAWAPWQYADDEGLFGGRWDDQLGQFRTIYTADSLLGCFLELLARFRPSRKVL